ncbi:P-loop containing nucleoside triphosphate hydrolase protein [Gaertneriomyces semiglobifer]|nr:P-loop containing nucleoside triphosphate hydrolase protein [Gaertneriomyces semiglobifer]
MFKGLLRFTTGSYKINPYNSITGLALLVRKKVPVNTMSYYRHPNYRRSTPAAQKDDAKPASRPSNDPQEHTRPGSIPSGVNTPTTSGRRATSIHERLGPPVSDSANGRGGHRANPSTKPLPVAGQQGAPQRRKQASNNNETQPMTNPMELPVMATITSTPELSPFDLSRDANTIKVYAERLNVDLEPEFEQHHLQRSTTGGGVQQYFTGKLVIPAPPTSATPNHVSTIPPPIIVTAQGTSKKTCRQYLYHEARKRLDDEGWLNIAARMKRRNQKQRNAAKVPKRSGSSDIDSWESTSIRPIAAASTPLANTMVPSAWDDEPSYTSERIIPSLPPSLDKVNITVQRAPPPPAPIDQKKGWNLGSAPVQDSAPVESDATSRLRIPPGIPDADRKLISFYCEQCNIALPNVACRSRSSNRRKPNQEGWDATLRLPPHTFRNQAMREIVAVGHAANKKSATTKAWHTLYIRLLGVVDQDFIDNWAAHALPFKTRLRNLIDEPARIELDDNVLRSLEDVIAQLEAQDAFAVSENASARDARDASSSEGFDMLTLPNGTPVPPTRERPLRALDVRVPAELQSNRLPIFTQYRELMSAIENNPVTIISAETGAGKTTQLPQFLMAHHKQHYGGQKPAHMVVTQPRRIAAISVAERVAVERGERVGTRGCAVGYTVRFDDKRPTDTANGSVVFCTSGILLKRLQQDPHLNGVTHLILDEVHERDLNTDLLLVIVRQMLQRRPDLRVVLMSATAETELFQQYFRGYGGADTDGYPPIISVPGRMFPVEQFLLDDVEVLLRRTQALPAPFRPCKESVMWVQNELGPMMPHRGEDPVPYDYIEALLAHICTQRGDGAVLVFLPGWQEIDTLHQRLKDEDTYGVGFRNEKFFRIFPLHSSVPTASQQLIFDRPPSGVRKIILSTNIAETSVTIEDIVYVIDTAKTRINQYDPARRISSLQSVWSSLSNLRQRSGRAGRCQPGLYFSLLSAHRKETLSYSLKPELLRVDLQSTVLKVKALGLARHCMDVFTAAPEPPSVSAVMMALEELKSLGAIDDEERLTVVGTVLAAMPQDPWISKMVLEAAIVGCLDPILTIAAGMESGRGIFAIHPEQREEGRMHVLTTFAVGTDSDHLTLLNAFNQWKKVAERDMYTGGGGSGRRVNYGASGAAREYARRNFLHHTTMVNIERSRQQLLRILEECHLVRRPPPARGKYDRDVEETGMVGGVESNLLSERLDMVRAVLCGALYPNVAQVSGKDEYRVKNLQSKVFLTGACVCSWKGIVTTRGGKLPTKTTMTTKFNISGRRDGPAQSSAVADVYDYDTLPDDENDGSSSIDDESALASLPEPPVPLRLLCFQEKQQVDAMIFLRNATATTPLELFLFSNPEDHVSDGGAGDRYDAADQEQSLYINNWIEVAVRNGRTFAVLREVQAWYQRYIKWVLMSRTRKVHGWNENREMAKQWAILGNMLVAEIAKAVESERRM